MTKRNSLDFNKQPLEVNERRNFLSRLFYWTLAFLTIIPSKTDAEIMALQKDKTALASNNNRETVLKKLEVINKQLVQASKKGVDTPVNVRDFEHLVVGDDWTDAIQYALNNYSRIFIPRGSYKISQTLKTGDNTSVYLEGESARQVNNSECAVIFPTTDVDVIELGDCSTFEGGIISANYMQSFTNSFIKIDFSTSLRYKIRIDTTLLGDGGGYGVSFYGNGNGGEGVDTKVNGFISGFEVGVHGEKVAGDCWYTGLFVDAMIMNCTQAIKLLDVGSGGRLSGTFQPNIASAGSENTEERALVELDTKNLTIDGLFWDMNTSINKYGLHLKSNALWVQLLSASDFEIKNELKFPYNKLNMVEMDFEKGTIFPTKANTLRGTFSGTQDNLLLGAHKKFTVKKIYDNSLIYLENPNSCFLGSDGVVVAQLFTSAPKNVDIPFSYEIIFDKPRHFHFMGFAFEGGMYPYYYKMSRKINGKYIIIKEGNPNSLFFDGKNNWGVDSIVTSGRISGEPITPFVEAIKFEFIINSSKDGNEAVKLTNLFYKDGTTNQNFLPAYGGKLFGDLNLNKNKLTNHVLEQNTSSKRPRAPAKGQMFYDTTLKKPIWFNGTVWTDATGMKV